MSLTIIALVRTGKFIFVLHQQIERVQLARSDLQAAFACTPYMLSTESDIEG